MFDNNLYLLIEKGGPLLNSVFLDFLKERDINIIKLTDSIIKVESRQIVFAYISRLEGLGNNSSDIDIYVISDEVPGREVANENEKTFIDVVDLGRTSLDIEYWSTKKADDLIDALNIKNYEKVGMDELKFLHRLSIGVNIYEDKLTQAYRDRINKVNIQECLYLIYRKGAVNLMDDAIKLFYAEDYVTALSIARAALEQSLAVSNTTHGKLNMKRKWVPKIFVDNNGYNEGILERYMNLQVYCNITKENISQYVEGIIELTQDILSKSMI